jgi:hypothetical protein
MSELRAEAGKRFDDDLRKLETFKIEEMVSIRLLT